MAVTFKTSRPLRCRSRHRHTRLNLEHLECRNLLSAPSGPGLLPLPLPVETLDQAKNLYAGDEAVGMIGNGPAGAADVDWFHFHLYSASDVTLATHDQAEGRSLVSVLTLYNTTEPFDPINQIGDYYDPLGHRMLAQSSGSTQAPDASIEEWLGPGDYYVAVSGAGNRYFHPLVVGSGYPGATGDYSLSLQAADLGLGQGTPAILSMSPAPGAVLNQSPLNIYLDLSNDPDPSFNYQQVQLVYSATGDFSNATAVGVNYNYSALAHEPQLTPGAPFQPGNWAPGVALQPGYYKLVIGTDGQGNPVLDNPGNLPLVFQVVGNQVSPGVPGGDNPLTEAHDLKNVTNAGLVQVPGTLGGDYIDAFTNFDVNDVQLYHFQVTGSGQYQITAEVFAGRIGSPLNAALSLYQLEGGQLVYVAANADTTDMTETVDGLSQPLYTDPMLTAGLTAGDYYLAVSSGLNVPDPVFGLQPNSGGVFDPNAPHSGQNGDTTGAFVLNFLVEPHQQTPKVVSVTRDDGIIPGGAPVYFVVQFNEPVNVQQLAFEAYQNYLQGGQNQMPAVFITQAGQNCSYLRLDSYDATTNTATFLVMDGLANGTYQLHLSGPDGFQDLAGNPLAGSSGPGSDFVYTFTVNDPARAPGNNPQLRDNSNPTASPQKLGALFGNDMQGTVTYNGTTYTGLVVVRPASSNVVAADVYEIQVTCPQDYVFNVIGTGGVPLVSTDAAGLHQAPLNTQGGQNSNSAAEYTLTPGVYYVHIPAGSSGLNYVLNISMLGQFERPTPLALGAAPAIRLRVIADVPPPPVTTPPVPPSTGPASGDLPSTVLLALGSGPLGSTNPGRNTLVGVDLLEQVVAQAPRLLESGELVQLVSLLQGFNLAGVGIAVEDTTAPATGLDPHDLWHSLPWGQVADVLSTLWATMGQISIQSIQEEIVPETPNVDLEEAHVEIASPATDPESLALAGVMAGFWFGVERKSRSRRQLLALAQDPGQEIPTPWTA